MCKSVYRHFYGDASSSACAQVAAISTEDGALGKGTDFACFCLMNAVQMLGTAAQLVVSV